MGFHWNCSYLLFFHPRILAVPHRVCINGILLQIFFKITDIHCSIWPSVLSSSPLLIISVASLICITSYCCWSPNSITWSQTIRKVANVKRSIFPNVLPLTLKFLIEIVALVRISVWKLFFFEVLFSLFLVTRFVCPFSIAPLTVYDFPEGVSKLSKAISFAFFPSTFVNLVHKWLHPSFTLPFTIKELSFIDIFWVITNVLSGIY